MKILKKYKIPLLAVIIVVALSAAILLAVKVMNTDKGDKLSEADSSQSQASVSLTQLEITEWQTSPQTNESPNSDNSTAPAPTDSAPAASVPQTAAQTTLKQADSDVKQAGQKTTTKSGSAVKLSSKELRKLNLFLSNFSESYLYEFDRNGDYNAEIIEMMMCYFFRNCEDKIDYSYDSGRYRDGTVIHMVCFKRADGEKRQQIFWL